MAFAEPTTQADPAVYSTPSNSDLAAVAATVAAVGIVMAVLITWLVVRLRRAADSQSSPIPIVARRPASTATYTFRPSFAPSEASSKFGFIRKPLRLSHLDEDGSWDFADPDPFSHQKESPVRTLSQKHRPAPLSPAPIYTPAHRASTHRDEFSPRTPRTPSTPGTPGFEPPPPAYCRENSPWPVSAKALSPS
ncbi:hypothetical protein OG21DRAFT_1485215 [Imleria badia]|nr:hypothetical protein OG21DRAFT_1485215 [Imleria badia]